MCKLFYILTFSVEVLCQFETLKLLHWWKNEGTIQIWIYWNILETVEQESGVNHRCIKRSFLKKEEGGNGVRVKTCFLSFKNTVNIFTCTIFGRHLIFCQLVRIWIWLGFNSNSLIMTFVKINAHLAMYLIWQNDI